MVLFFTLYPPEYNVPVIVILCSAPYYAIPPTPKILPSIS